MDLPTNWVNRDGQPIQRPSGMTDAVWQNLLEAEGWTPGASGAGSPAEMTPAQTLALVFQAITSGVQVASSIYGTVTEADPATGMATLESGAQVPVSSLGVVTAPGLNVTPTGFAGQMTAVYVGAGALVLLVLVMVLKK